jgi:probable rRNA maturation factor
MPRARRRARPAPPLHVIVTDARGRPLRGTGLERWLPRAAPRTARGLVGIAIVSDRTMRGLNRQYRGADYATDVLAFPAAPPGPLGDIVIARGVTARQAREYGHTAGVELRILALHGLLHLLGYDHEADRGRMRQVEERLRRRAGLPAGLTGRVSGSGPRR